MVRTSIPCLVSLVAVCLFPAPARGQVPTGRFEVQGDVSTPAGDVPLEGTLTLERTSTGFSLSRRARPAGGRLERWDGLAAVESGTLAFQLRRGGIVARLSGASRGESLRAIYRIQDDGSLRGVVTVVRGSVEDVRGHEVARIDTSRLSRDQYFSFVDQVPGFRRLAAREPLMALLEFIARADVPPRVDRDYTRRARSPGGGRVLMALDYTRGYPSEPTWPAALRQGPKGLVVSKFLTPMLTHFRAVDGVEIFRGDGGYVEPFKDSHLTSAETNQVGHLLCAVATGFRAGSYMRRPLSRWAYELGLRVAGRLFGLHGVQPTIADWSRAGIIGHELIGDEDGSGFLGQMNAYGRLVANGDPDGVRAAWDEAVAAVLAGDHQTAWRAVRVIARAGQIPETVAEMERNRLDPAPRFAAPGSARGGNSLADLALSAYGFALGQRAGGAGYPTPAAARAGLEAFLAASGEDAAEVIRAAE